MTALEDARAALAHPDGLGYDYVIAAALVSIAESLEVVAAAQAQHALIERDYAEQSDDFGLFDSEPYRRIATVLSPYLMNVDHGHDEGAEREP